MITISIKALGQLKHKISTNASLELHDNESIYVMLDRLFSLPRLESSRFNFVVNGRIQKGDYLLQNKDDLTVLKMGGAG